jgi:hypothetical protein
MQDGRVSDSGQLRGPDFLPYPLPDRPVAPAIEVMPAAEPGSRWEQALNGVTPWGVAAISAGLAALLSLLIISVLSGHRWAGAALASLTAVVSTAAGLRALREEQPADSRSLVRAGMATGWASAAIALLLLLTHRSAVAEQPPVQVPVPVPSATTSPQQPSPAPTVEPSPRFGVPTQPAPPVTDDPTAKGTLTGRVVGTGGAPVAGTTVVVTRADPADTTEAPGCPLRVTTTTRADGRYSLQLCQLGNFLGYTVTISSGGASASADLFVNAGRTTIYNVILAVRHA